MSRVGKQPIRFQMGVEVNVQASAVHVKGPKGELEIDAVSAVRVTVEDRAVRVDRVVENPRGPRFARSHSLVGRQHGAGSNFGISQDA